METQRLATQIVQTLRDNGFIAYFAGGWVRDYLMGHPSDDVDIATDANPTEILSLFPNTIEVGIAFGVVVVLMDGHQFEVATFRKDLAYEDGRKPTGIVPSPPHEDAKRRDFTINGMFYDPLDGTIHDFVNGRQDLHHQVIRAIGNADERFVEDRLRMIRAVRFAARFGFRIDQETEVAIFENANTLLPSVSMERVWDEFRKMAKTPQVAHAFVDLHRFGLLPVIFPELEGTHLNEIKKRVAPFEHYPLDAPTIAYVLALFPEKTEEEITDLCKYLKTSNRVVQFAHLLKQGEKEPSDLYDWSLYYAHSDVMQCLHILAAPLTENERITFIKTHHERIKALKNPITRIQTRRPLVNAEMLQKLGIPRGKGLGALIEEGERIAANQNLQNKDEVLNQLKRSALWKPI